LVEVKFAVKMHWHYKNGTVTIKVSLELLECKSLQCRSSYSYV